MRNNMKEKMRILIAYDGSDHAGDAIMDLELAGIPNEVEATVLTVSDTWGLPDAMDRVSASSGRFVPSSTRRIQSHLSHLKDQARTLAEIGAGRVSELFPDWNVKAEENLGKPAWEIIEKADEWKADLIVVGSQGRSALGRALLGSVSQKVLHESRCSVRIARKRGENSTGSTRVLVAVDGSAFAEAAVKTVAARSWPKDAEIRIIAVNDPFIHPAGGYVGWDTAEDQPEDTEESRDWLEEMIETPKRVLRDAGIANVSHAIRWGDAGNMILHEAEDWKADSIFLGARGIGRFRRFLLGSVSSTVAARAICSVEVIRLKEATKHASKNNERN